MASVATAIIDLMLWYLLHFPARATRGVGIALR